MAGFYLVGMLLILVIIFAAIMWVLEIISVLSIIFSSISLSKSKKFINLGGRYDYRSVKRFHTAAVVLFVFGCIGIAFSGIGVLALITDYISDVSFYDDLEAVIGLLLMGAVGIGKYVVLIILGVKSFRKFAQARDLYESLRLNAARFYPRGANMYARNTAQNAYYQNTDGGFDAAPFYDRNNYGGFDPYRNISAGGSAGNTVGGTANGGGSESGSIVGNKAADAVNGTFGDTIPEKICPKCGCANCGLYKYCTLCGEKL